MNPCGVSHLPEDVYRFLQISAADVVPSSCVVLVHITTPPTAKTERERERVKDHHNFAAPHKEFIRTTNHNTPMRFQLLAPAKNACGGGVLLALLAWVSWAIMLGTFGTFQN